jgi:hypothetical protein
VSRVRAAVLAGALLVGAGAAPVSAQTAGQTPPGPTTINPVPLGPGLPAEEPPRRAPITLTPSLFVSEEYNDNIRLTNRNRQSDFITGFTPGLQLTFARTTYEVTALYRFTSELYADHSELDQVLRRQDFFLNAFWRATPRLTLSLADSFVSSTDSNIVTVEGVSTGRTRARSNTFTPGLTYRLTPLTNVRVTTSYTHQEFDAAELRGSDIFRGDVAFDRRFTPRLTGTAGYTFQYFDIQRQPDSTTHTLRLGATYRFTPTLTGAVAVGPTLEVREGDTTLRPFASVSLTNRFRWGSINGQYDRTVGTAGGLGGTTQNDVVHGLVQVTRIMRGLGLEFAPRFTSVQGDADQGDRGDIDVRTITLTLRAVYRFNQWIAAAAGYTFFQQRSDRGGSGLTNDVDQNRVYVGLQFGYPIRFD